MCYSFYQRSLLIKRYDIIEIISNEYLEFREKILTDEVLVEIGEITQIRGSFILHNTTVRRIGGRE